MDEDRKDIWDAVYRIPYPIRLAVGYGLFMPVGVVLAFIGGAVGGAYDGARGAVGGFLESIRRARRG